MACFQRESPALREILLKLYRAEKPVEIDHHIHEFGSVEYHVQSSAADPHDNFLSISIPLLSQGTELPTMLSPHALETVKKVCSGAAEVVEPAKEGYQLTLRLLFSVLPRGKESEKVIRRIASVQAVILSSQLKELLLNVNAQNISQGIYKPIKLVHHPREPFYVIRQPQKIIAVFPMRFKDASDVIIATTFFQELVDVASSEKWAKVPPCTWSAIPPPELRGEPLEDLSTNGGFVSFDIFSRHVKGKKLEKTVWSLLNFYTYMKNHVKCTRGFIQRRMLKRTDDLVKVLREGDKKKDATNEIAEENVGCLDIGKLVKIPKAKNLKQRWGNFKRNINQIRSRIKIRGIGRFRRRWLTLPKFSSSSMGYSRLD